MKRVFLVVLLLLPGFAWAEPPEVTGDLSRTLAGEATIHLSFVTNAAPEKIWKALTAEDELVKWAAPEVKVQLRAGGIYEYYFFPKRNEGRRGMEGTRVLAFVPGKMLVHSGVLPDTWIVWSIEPAGDQQAVHYYAVGATSDWIESANARVPLAQEVVERLAKYLQP